LTYGARTKYDQPGRARRYAARSARRDEEEWRLLASVLDGLPVAPRDALDVPCGTGRIARRLLERGIPTRGADLSAAMRGEAWASLRGAPGFLGVVAMDLEEAPTDPSLPADLVVCFRFLHHLPDAATRGRVLRSLRALTRGTLLLSFHHPVSPHNARRTLARWLTGRRSTRRTMGVRRLRAEAAAAGLDLVGVRALSPYLRELWVAVLTPRAEPAPAVRGA
jgi:SAM-dependent methyltransferase